MDSAAARPFGQDTGPGEIDDCTNANTVLWYSFLDDGHYFRNQRLWADPTGGSAYRCLHPLARGLNLLAEAGA